MELLAFSVGLLAVLGLGLSAGALLAEAGVLVPFWQAQKPEAFLDWYRENASRLLGFFGPLEAAGGCPLAHARYGLLARNRTFGDRASSVLDCLSFPSIPVPGITRERPDRWGVFIF